MTWLKKKVNVHGYTYVEPAHADLCIGCAACATVCPDGCITVYKKRVEEIRMAEKEVTLMKGNEAIAHAAIRCGADGYFGYPITPQSEIIETLALLNHGKQLVWLFCSRKRNFFY